MVVEKYGIEFVVSSSIAFRLDTLKAVVRGDEKSILVLLTENQQHTVTKEKDLALYE